MILDKESLNTEIHREQKESILSRHVTLMQFFATILQCSRNIPCANKKLLPRKLEFNSWTKVNYEKKLFHNGHNTSIRSRIDLDVDIKINSTANFFDVPFRCNFY